VVAACLAAGNVAADPADVGTLELGPPFSDAAVLQREMPVPVWGWSQPGSTVSVEFAGQTTTATAGVDGKWMVTLAPLTASDRPQAMTVRGPRGEKRVLEDILVGEVWLASGQSNMQWLAGKCDAALLIERIEKEAEAAGRSLPPIREWSVDDAYAALHPIRHAHGRWKTDSFREYSGIAFAFAEALQRELDVPIGILNCSFSQTSIEAWTPRGGFAAGSDEHSREMHRRILETDPATPEHAAAWQAYYDSIEESLAADAARVARGEEARGIPTATPGNMRSNRDASWLFNARLAPAIPYAIRGCIWNQGYANINGGLTYYDNLHALVRGWREAWGRDLPVYFHQFYTPSSKGEAPVGPSIAPLAEMRLGTWLARDIPHTGMASQIDVEGAIHYRSKTVPGRRLARHALKNDYGREIVADGPMYRNYVVRGNTLTVEFDHADGGLVVAESGTNARGKAEGATGFSDPLVIERGAEKVTLFYLADDNAIWHPAKLVIDGETAVLTADGVESPRGVSYASGGVGFRPNLYNRDLLPMTPFIVYDHTLVTSRNWNKPLVVAGIEPDASQAGLVYDYRKMPLLAAAFRDHAVLQADRPLTIWGSCRHDWGHEAAGDAQIHFHFSGPDIEPVAKTIPVTPGMREWRVTLPAMPPSTEPKTLRVRFSIDGQLVHERTAEGVVVGDVWYVAAAGQAEQAEAADGQVRIFTRKAKRTTHPLPSRYSIAVSTTPGNRFASQWRNVAAGPAAALGRRLHERSGRPVGLVWMAGGDLGLPQWIGFDQLADTPSLRADYENLAAGRPGNPLYEANARRHMAAWKSYWKEEVPQLIASGRPTGGAAWGSFPRLTSQVTSKASAGYNVMVAPFADFGFKGILFLAGPGSVASDEGSLYGEQLAALAASWRRTFGGRPAFGYLVPSRSLAAKITAPKGIAPPAIAVTVDSWDEAAAIEKLLDKIDAAGLPE